MSNYDLPPICRYAVGMLVNARVPSRSGGRNTRRGRIVGCELRIWTKEEGFIYAVRLDKKFHNRQIYRLIPEKDVKPINLSGEQAWSEDEFPTRTRGYYVTGRV